MAESDRSSAELIEALRHHSVEGYPVITPLGAAKILRQGGTNPVSTFNLDTRSQTHGNPWLFYRVKLDRPIPFSEFSKMRRLSTEPLTNEQWLEKIDSARSGAQVRAIVLLGDEANRRLAAGQSVSEYEATYESMADGGELDGDGRVAEASFYPRQVSMDPKKLRKGMLLEFENQKSDRRGEHHVTWNGRYIGPSKKDAGIGLLEVFQPIPLIETFGMVKLAAVHPGFYSEGTFLLGYGVAHGWEDSTMPEWRKKHGYSGDMDPDLGPYPPGKWTQDKMQYILEDAIPISLIETYCKRYHPGIQQCTLQSLLLYILPIPFDEGKWRPLPENVVPDEFVWTFGDE